MRPVPALTLATLVAAGVALGACADVSPTGPDAAQPVHVFDVAFGEDAGPDSGDVVVRAIDDVTAAGEARLGVMAVAALRDIRVGVVQSAPNQQLTLGSAASYTIIDSVTGVVLASGTNDAATVTLTQAPPTYYRLQVSCLNAATTATRLAAAQAAGYVTFTEFVPAANCTRLYLGEFAPPPANNFAARNAFRNQAIAGGFAGTDSFWRVVSVGSATYAVARSGAPSATTVNPVVLSSTDGVVTINGVRYRGRGVARVNGAGTLAGINVLPVEQYLYGVVPRELGPLAFPEVEAQKAQAVAARTYAIRGFDKRASDGYDLRATTDDQVYGGYDAEHPVSSAAVDATAGVVAKYNGELIDALFSSTSGGHTANSEEAFTNKLDYLRGVPDAERGRALDRVPTLEVFKASANPTSLRAAREGDFEANWASRHRWTFEWTSEEITQVISTFAGQPVGRVLAINVVARGPSGRALRVDYVTEAGTFTSLKDVSTRGALKFIGAAGVPTNLPSTLFFIEPVVDPTTKEKRGFRAYGGGFGHGVGLAQTGAVGMAQRGHTYEQILQLYYRGITLERIGGIGGAAAMP